jgi:transcriptional regulator with XRE-family HTH domain
VSRPRRCQPRGVIFFQDNLPRLLGLHNLSAREASEHLNVSQVALSAISTGKRKPSLDTLMTLAGFFEVSADRLMTAPFEDLLPELCDKERYTRVEEKIRPGYAALARGDVVDIVTGEAAKPKKPRR